MPRNEAYQQLLDVIDGLHEQVKHLRKHCPKIKPLTTKEMKAKVRGRRIRNIQKEIRLRKLAGLPVVQL